MSLGDPERSPKRSLRSLSTSGPSTDSRFGFGVHGCCAYSEGESPPEPMVLGLVESSLRLSMMLGAVVPQHIVVVRQRCSQRLSGWKRGCLVGMDGVIPYLGHEMAVERLFLEESDPLGLPQLRLTSGLLSEHVLKHYLIHLPSSLDGTGVTVPRTGSWTLSLTFPRRGTLICEGLRSPSRVQSVLSWAKRSYPRWQEEQFLQMMVELDPEKKQNESFAWQESRPARWEVDPEHPVVSIPQKAFDEWISTPYPKVWEIRSEMQLLKVPSDAIHGIFRMGHAELYKRCKHANPKVPVSVWGELLYRWPKALARKGVPTHNLTEQRFLAIASLHGMGRCERDALPDLLAFASLFPEIPVRHLLLQKMGVTPYSKEQLTKDLPQLLSGPLPRKLDWPSRERFWMGRVMAKLRGSISGQLVREALYQHFSTRPPTEYDRCEYPPQKPKRRERR